MTDLTALFPACITLLGEETFTDILTTARPDSANALIDALREYDAESPWLADLAELEWAIETAQQAKETAPFDLMSLSALSEAEYAHVVFTLTPGTTLLQSDFAIAELYQQVLNPQITAAMQSLTLELEQPCQLAIFKRQQQVVMIPLDDFALVLLAHFQQGGSLGQVQAMDPSQLLPALIEQRIVCGFTLDNSAI